MRAARRFGKNGPSPSAGIQNVQAVPTAWIWEQLLPLSGYARTPAFHNGTPGFLRIALSNALFDFAALPQEQPKLFLTFPGDCIPVLG